MSLSTLFTAKSFFRQATAEIRSFEQNSKIFAQRFELMNNVQAAVQGQVADIVAEAYMTDTVPVLSTTGKYYSSGASWDADTSQLTATMDSNFSSTDVGNLVIFRYGTGIYLGTIIQRISNTVVKLRGDNLPAVDLATVNDVMMSATGIDGASAIDISSLRMLRYTNQVKLRLESTATKYVQPLDPVSFQKFQTGAKNNLDKVVWMLQGNSLFVKMGTDIASAGTLKLWYPRIPDDVSSDTDYMDMIDGPMIQIGILALKIAIQKRISEPISPADIQEAGEKLSMLYNSAGNTIKKEEIKSKVEALV